MHIHSDDSLGRHGRLRIDTLDADAYIDGSVIDDSTAARHARLRHSRRRRVPVPRVVRESRVFAAPPRPRHAVRRTVAHGGGKIESGEAAWETARREVTEETGHAPTQFWTIPSVNAFYEWQGDRVNLIPAFAAMLPADPVLDDEHDAFTWLPAQEAVDRLAWPEQQRLLRLADRVIRNGIPPRLIVETGSG